MLFNNENFASKCAEVDGDSLAVIRPRMSLEAYSEEAQ